MAYPPLLKLEEEVKQDLVTWLNYTLNTHFAERTDFINEIVEDQELYWSEPAEVERKAPFKGAANIVIPLSAIAVETYHANLMQQLRALEDPFSGQAVHSEWVDATSPLEKYFNREMKHNVKLIDSLEGSYLDIEKHGTGVARAGYEKITKWGVKITPDGDEVEFPVVVKAGACVHSVPLYRFLMPFSAKDAQSAYWVGEECEDSLYEIDLMEREKFFDEGCVEHLRGYLKTQGQSDNNQAIRRQQELEKRIPIQPDTVKWYTIWTSFDVEQLDKIYEDFSSVFSTQLQGTPKEIIIYYHRESNYIMGIRYNWNEDLRRPYRHGVYFPIEHRWRGIGICKQTKMFQWEVTAMHRQRLDNATIANMRMFKVSKMSGYGPGEPIFPGKMWMLDDMDHIDTIQAGEIYSSDFNNETVTLQYQQQRVGLGDIQAGAADSGTPGTATDIMARVKEAKKRSDYTSGNVKRYTSEVMFDCVLEIKQWGVSNKSYVTNLEGGEWVQRFLDLPIEDIKDNIYINIDLTGERHSDLVDRNDWTQLAGLYQQYGTASMQLAQMTGDPEMLQKLAMILLRGSTRMFKEVLDSYKIPGSDQMVLKELIENVGINGAPPGGNQSGIVGGPGPAGPGNSAITKPSPGQLMAFGGKPSK